MILSIGRGTWKGDNYIMEDNEAGDISMRNISSLLDIKTSDHESFLFSLVPRYIPQL